MKSLIQKFAVTTCVVALLAMACSSLSAEEPGLYPLRTEPDGKYVYIDVSGQVVFKIDSDLGESFSQGFAAVNEAYSWHFIDKTGKRAFAQNYLEIRAFSEGLAAVKIGDLWGYIDLNGKTAIEAKFDQAYRFSEGLACVMANDPDDGLPRYGYVDKTGKYVIEPFLHSLDNQFFSPPGEFSEGLAAAWLPLNNDNDCMVGYINKEGKIAIAPKYTIGGKFVDGLAPVSIMTHPEEAPTGFIDKSGNFVIPQKFSMASHFSEGLAPAATFEPEYVEPRTWGFINSKGEWVIKPVYELTENFAGGLARAYYQLADCNEIYIKKDNSVVANSSTLSGKKATAPGTYKLRIEMVDASSSLPPINNIYYGPNKLIDGDIKSAWVENAKGNGQGEWVSFSFESPVEIHSIDIYNGYQKPATEKRDPFTRNSSVAAVRITCGSKTSEHKLKNERGAQTINLEPVVTETVKIEILEVHENKGDLDCCISEVEFTGRIAP